eukprot:8010154-Pyramimonas_sp.AAC.1
MTGYLVWTLLGGAGVEGTHLPDGALAAGPHEHEGGDPDKLLVHRRREGRLPQHLRRVRANSAASRLHLALSS